MLPAGRTHVKPYPVGMPGALVTWSGLVKFSGRARRRTFVPIVGCVIPPVLWLPAEPTVARCGPPGTQGSGRPTTRFSRAPAGTHDSDDRVDVV